MAKSSTPATPMVSVNLIEALPAQWIKLAKGLRAVHELRKQAAHERIRTGEDQYIIQGCRSAIAIEELLRLAGSRDLVAVLERAYELNPEAAVGFIATRLLDEQGNLIKL